MKADVVLVHDWLTGMRGGEKVLLELCRIFPAAPVYTLVWKQGSVAAEIEDRVAGVSFLDRLPGARERYRHYLPLFPAAVRALRLPDCALVVSSSHAVAKAVCKPQGARHLSYVHTPMRYAWGFGGAASAARGLNRLALWSIAPALRRFDRRTEGVDALVANSETVRDRIRRVWNRDAEVAHPPVDTNFFTPDDKPPGDAYLLVSALEPYKRVDVALEAFRRRGRRLIVVGGGTLENALRRRYPDAGDFRGRVDDQELRRLYRCCRALVFPAEEDFGITPVEAQACGRPVVALGRGGALETVVEGETGTFFPDQTPDALLRALDRAAEVEWNPAHIRARALRFSRDAFRDRMGAILEARLGFRLPSPPASDVESA